MKRLSIACAAIVLLVAAAGVHAEELPPPVRVTASVLSLSEDQVRALVGMLQAREQALYPVAEQLEGKHKALDQLLQQGTAADPAAVGRLVLDIAALQKQVGAVAQQTAQQFEQTLTQEQRDRLNALRGAAPTCDVIPALRAVGLL